MHDTERPPVIGRPSHSQKYKQIKKKKYRQRAICGRGAHSASINGVFVSVVCVLVESVRRGAVSIPNSSSLFVSVRSTFPCSPSLQVRSKCIYRVLPRSSRITPPITIRNRPIAEPSDPLPTKHTTHRTTETNIAKKAIRLKQRNKKKNKQFTNRWLKTTTTMTIEQTTKQQPSEERERDK